MSSNVHREIKLIRGLSRMALLCWLRYSWSIGTKVSHRSECGKLETRLKDEECANTLTRSHQCEPARGEMLTHVELTWELERQLSAACLLSLAPLRCNPPCCSHLLNIKAALQATMRLNLYHPGEVSNKHFFFLLRAELQGCQKSTLNCGGELTALWAWNSTIPKTQEVAEAEHGFI